MYTSELAVDDATLAAWLREDAPYGDLTTRTLSLVGRPGHMRFSARGAMRVAGTEEAARLVRLAGADARVQAPSGSAVAPGTLLLDAEGDAPALLLAWKVAQTLVEAASGIATATAAIVTALRDAGCPLPVACTRKTMPGTRALAAKAVHAGGGIMHRLGLSESLLVFPEHRVFVAHDRLAATLATAHKAQPEKKLVVEVVTVDEALDMAHAGAEVLQLERFVPSGVAELRQRLNVLGLTPRLAAAGGIDADNAVAYARAGADLIVTSAPYFARPADVKVVIAAATA